MNSKLMAFVKDKFLKIAQDLMENPQGLKFKLESALEKVNKENVKVSLGQYVEELKTLIRMLKAWVTRKYRGVSTNTVLYTIVAVVYFLNPTDFIPDFILGLGFVDDIAVIAWVLDMIKEDVEKFRQWEEKKNKKTAAKEKQEQKGKQE